MRCIASAVVGFGRESVFMEAGAGDGSGSSESELEPESDNSGSGIIRCLQPRNTTKRRLTPPFGHGGDGGSGRRGRADQK